MTNTLSTPEFLQKFPTEETVRTFFEARRWAGNPVCGHCESVNVTECKDHRPMAYRCRDCRKHFSVRTGTILAESRLPLKTWLLAICMLTSARKGIPSKQMARELRVTKKTAWLLAKRIRETWLKDQDDHMDGPVQIGETYAGGLERNKHADKKLRAGRGTVGKSAVVGGGSSTGGMRAVVVENTKASTLSRFIRQHAKPRATIVTDTHGGHIGLSDDSCNQVRINHLASEYVRTTARTSGIESFRSLLKRGYIRIYHYMSAKHLNRGVKGFLFRHNSAQVGPMDFINMTIARMDAKRLTYKELTNA
ncbi:IS1595 family transposase [Maricaulis salignorans]|uniref:IS1595 family transposase n=1 Tax=Maricaulis salignorans TaxID=144026 RepID=UPI003A90C415